MKLFIDTTENNSVNILLQKDGRALMRRKIRAVYSQAEKLLPLIDKTLKIAGIKPDDLKEIKVNNKGGSFSSLRLGVITANALNYALIAGKGGVKHINKISIIRPIYSGEPNISKKKSSVD